MVRAKNYETVSESVKVMPKILWPLFSENGVYAERAICYCPSVRLSVTRGDQTKTIEVRIMQLSPKSSPILLTQSVKVIQIKL